MTDAERQTAINGLLAKFRKLNGATGPRLNSEDPENLIETGLLSIDEIRDCGYRKKVVGTLDAKVSDRIIKAVIRKNPEQKPLSKKGGPR